MDDTFLTGDYLQLFTDASGGIGYGAICGPEWFLVDGPVPGIPLTSQYLSYIRSWRLWRRGVFLGLTVVCFFTDNEALVTIINKQTSREPSVMVLMRKLVLSCLRYNIQFTARHVPGRDNTLADK